MSSDSTASQRFVAAGVGAAIAEVVTLPIDVTKTRLQMQASNGSTVRYTGLVQGMYRIGMDEGSAALWRGLQPALVRQVSYTGMAFVLYEPVRTAIAGGVHKDEISFGQRVLAGGTAGAVSIMALNPTDVIKTQMQAHKGEMPLMRSIVRTIFEGAGVIGFWRGWQPNVARCFVVNAAELGCYDEAKTRLIAAGVPDGPLGHFGASGVAGLASAICSTPLDVVKTRLMAQAGGVHTVGMVQYKGVLDCFVRLAQTEGLSALYKGFVPSVPHTPYAIVGTT